MDNRARVLSEWRFPKCVSWSRCVLTLAPLLTFLDIASLFLIILWYFWTALVARLQQRPNFQSYNPFILFAAKSISPILSLEPLLNTFEPSCFKLLPPKLQVFYRKPQVVPSVINISSLSYYKPQDYYLERRKGSSAVHIFALRLERYLQVFVFWIPFFPSTPPPMAARQDFLWMSAQFPYVLAINQYLGHFNT